MGQANGFKPKRLKTRIGRLRLAVPQVRGAKFYPRVLERGSRSEKVLRLALAEMYVQGVSTSKVTKMSLVNDGQPTRLECTFDLL